MPYEQIMVRKHGPIEWIVLNRPERLNALSKQMVSELLAAFDDADKDPEARVVILKGTGRAFCAGADLKEYPAAIRGGMGEDISFFGLWEKIEHLEKPVIAAVHGFAVTGGFLLAYCCDLIVAAQHTRFGDTHARLGLVPTSGETQRLPRRAGVWKAKELMFTSELVDARELERMGLVSKVVPEEMLERTALELAQKIAANSAKSLKFLKTMINRGLEVDFATGMRMEAIANNWGTINAEPDEDRDRRLTPFRGA